MFLEFVGVLVTLFTSPPDVSVVFFSFVCLFLLCVWCFFSLVAAAFLANKDVYKNTVTKLKQYVIELNLFVKTPTWSCVLRSASIFICHCISYSSTTAMKL